MGNLGHFPQEKPAATESCYCYPTLIHYGVHAGSFRVSIIHQTLMGTTGALTCVRDHSYACVSYTWGLGTPTVSQHNILDSEELTNFSCAPEADVVRTSSLWISSPMLY